MLPYILDGASGGVDGGQLGGGGLASRQLEETFGRPGTELEERSRGSVVLDAEAQALRVGRAGARDEIRGEVEAAEDVEDIVLAVQPGAIDDAERLVALDHRGINVKVNVVVSVDIHGPHNGMVRVINRDKGVTLRVSAAEILRQGIRPVRPVAELELIEASHVGTVPVPVLEVAVNERVSTGSGHISETRREHLRYVDRTYTKPAYSLSQARQGVADAAMAIVAIVNFMMRVA